MRRTWVLVLTLAVLLSQNAVAQDAKTVISNASKAMGVERLNSIHYYGVAQNGNFGQNSNANQPWPMINASDYQRAIDFNAPASRATWVTYQIGVFDMAPVQAPGQQNITAKDTAWAQQLEIWITPWGFVKGAMTNNATARAQTVNGRRYQVVTFSPAVKSPGGQPYRVVGYINGDNLVESVQTWVEQAMYGDLLVEAEYTAYREGPDGLKFPANIVQKRGGWPTFTAFIQGAAPNPTNIAQLLTVPPPQGGAAGGGGGQQAQADPFSEKLADGVFRIRSGYNALAVEFSDHIVLFEPGPNNDARAQALMAEAKKLIPNKPIRYGVISHHHFDHTSGLPAVVAEGVTIVTPEMNRNFLMSLLSAPRTLAPDAMSKSGRKPVIEGMKGSKRVFQDSTRTFEVHEIKGLPHADGLVIGYLPKEKIIVAGDIFIPRPANDPAPDPPTRLYWMATVRLLELIENQKLDVDRILNVHVLNPDRLYTLAEFKAALGRK